MKWRKINIILLSAQNCIWLLVSFYYNHDLNLCVSALHHKWHLKNYISSRPAGAVKMLTDINSKLFVGLTDGIPTVVISISASFFFQKNFQKFVLFKWPDKYSNHCWMFATFHITAVFSPYLYRKQNNFSPRFELRHLCRRDDLVNEFSSLLMTHPDPTHTMVDLKGKYHK